MASLLVLPLLPSLSAGPPLPSWLRGGTFAPSAAVGVAVSAAHAEMESDKGRPATIAPCHMDVICKPGVPGGRLRLGSGPAVDVGGGVGGVSDGDGDGDGSAGGSGSSCAGSPWLPWSPWSPARASPVTSPATGLGSRDCVPGSDSIGLLGSAAVSPVRVWVLAILPALDAAMFASPVPMCIEAGVGVGLVAVFLKVAMAMYDVDHPCTHVLRWCAEDPIVLQCAKQA